MGKRVAHNHDFNSNDSATPMELPAYLSKDSSGDEKAPFPFTFKYTPSTWQRIRFFLMLIFVFPIRLVGVIVCLLAAGLSAKILLAFHPKNLPGRLPKWRRISKWFNVTLLRMVFFFLGVHYIKTKGKRVSASEAPILCAAPHSSLLDTLVCLIYPVPCVVSTTTNRDMPLIGTMFRVMEAIFVNRSDPSSCEKSTEEIVRRAQAMGEWPQIVCFPEGVCTNRKSLLTFKRGAFLAGVPIQPFLVRYNNELDNTTWLGNGPGQLAVIVLAMCTPYTNMEIEFLPVYYPSSEEKTNPDLYAENVRQQIAKHLKIPISPYTYKDLKAFIAATGRPERGLVHFLSQLWYHGKVVMPSSIPESYSDYHF